jgi:hypothetical protein
VANQTRRPATSTSFTADEGAVGVGEDAHGPIELPVAGHALVRGEPHEGLVGRDRGHRLAGQPIFHAEAGGPPAAGVEPDGAVVGGDPDGRFIGRELVDGPRGGEDAPAIQGLMDEDLARAEPDPLARVRGGGRRARRREERQRCEKEEAAGSEEAPQAVTFLTRSLATSVSPRPARPASAMCRTSAGVSCRG